MDEQQEPVNHHPDHRNDGSKPQRHLGRGLLDIAKAIKGPAIFESASGDFIANVTTGYASTFSNDISGDAGIVKQGTGLLALTGTNTFTGNTLQGGTLVANSQASLGNTSSALQFDGGTLRLGNNFNLTRDLTIGAGGGTLDINGYTKTQTFNISGTGQFGITGGGSQVNAQQDNYLGTSHAKLSLDNGQLNLLSGFVADVAGQFDRPIEVDAGNGTIATGNQALSFTGGVISGAGQLSFIGTPFSMGANLELNGWWGGDLTVPSGLVLNGTGGVNGNLTVAGTLAPGNSPGTLTVRAMSRKAAAVPFRPRSTAPAREPVPATMTVWC